MRLFLYTFFLSAFFALLVFVFLQIQAETKRSSYLKGFESGVSSVKIPITIPLPEKGCITGDFLIDGWIVGSYMRFGEMQMCVEIIDNKIIISSGDLIAGPDFSTSFNVLEDELSRWKDCAESILLCPSDFKRSEP